MNNIICKKKYVLGGWNGYKELVVTKKVKESNEITSFYFNTVNGEPLPKFKPGQYLSLRLPKGTFSSTGTGIFKNITYFIQMCVCMISNPKIQ